MSKLLIIGIIINTLSFGFAGFQNNKLGIHIPDFLRSTSLRILQNFLYFGSFILILISPGNIFIKILVCVALQFLVNHLVWGVVTGIIAGVSERGRRNKIREEAYHKYDFK